MNDSYILSICLISSQRETNNSHLYFQQYYGVRMTHIMVEDKLFNSGFF